MKHYPGGGHSTLKAPAAAAYHIERGIGATHGHFEDFLATLMDGKAGKQAQDYLSDTLSQAGQKFVKTPEGKGVIKDLSVNVLVPALVIGLAAGFVFGKWWK